MPKQNGVSHIVTLQRTLIKELPTLIRITDHNWSLLSKNPHWKPADHLNATKITVLNSLHCWGGKGRDEGLAKIPSRMLLTLTQTSTTRYGYYGFSFSNWHKWELLFLTVSILINCSPSQVLSCENYTRIQETSKLTLQEKKSPKISIWLKKIKYYVLWVSSDKHRHFGHIFLNGFFPQYFRTLQNLSATC